MRSTSFRLGLSAACVGLTLLGWATPAVAQEPDRSGPAERLERLERRVNEMAQRQEQLMQRLEAQRQGQTPVPAAGPENLRPPGSLPPGTGVGQPMPPAGAPALAGAPAPQGSAAGLAQLHRDIARVVKACALVGFVINILVAIWIYTDIRKRVEGSGFFIVLALLAGIPAAIVYALVRLSDKKV
jgi:hypothetical protein